MPVEASAIGKTAEAVPRFDLQYLLPRTVSALPRRQFNDEGSIVQRFPNCTLSTTSKTYPEMQPSTDSFDVGNPGSLWVERRPSSTISGSARNSSFSGFLPQRRWPSSQATGYRAIPTQKAQMTQDLRHPPSQRTLTSTAAMPRLDAVPASEFDQTNERFEACVPTGSLPGPRRHLGPLVSRVPERIQENLRFACDHIRNSLTFGVFRPESVDIGGRRRGLPAPGPRVPGGREKPANYPLSAGDFGVFALSQLFRAAHVEGGVVRRLASERKNNSTSAQALGPGDTYSLSTTQSRRTEGTGRTRRILGKFGQFSSKNHESQTRPLFTSLCLKHGTIPTRRLGRRIRRRPLPNTGGWAADFLKKRRFFSIPAGSEGAIVRFSDDPRSGIRICEICGSW